MGQSRPLFYFRSFLVTISIQIEKSIDGVLGIRTRGRRMVGTDKTTELWRPPFVNQYLQINFTPLILKILTQEQIYYYVILKLFFKRKIKISNTKFALGRLKLYFDQILTK